MATQKGRRILILDTSYLVHDPDCIEGFPDDTLIIPLWVVDELDHLKRSEGERGEHALQALRNIHEYGITGQLGKGVETKCGGLLRAESDAELPLGIEPSAVYKNIFLAKTLAESGGEIIILSKDISRRIKANMFGVTSTDDQDEGVIHDPYNIFPGCSEIALRSPDVMTEFYRNSWIPLGSVKQVSSFNTRMLIPNQCVRFTYEDKEALGVYKRVAQGMRLVSKPKISGNGKTAYKDIIPKNCEQAFAYSLLMDPEIRIAALVGSAGSGKTLMSLLSAKEHLKTEFDQGSKTAVHGSGAPCDQIIVFRPNIEIGQQLGFLPGTLEEKYEPWMYPILDNLDLIYGADGGYKNKTDPVADMIDSRTLIISPINHVRGRSFHDKFIIIDEAQNLTRHEIRSLITRTGKGSKVVLTGDISQIDHPYLDRTSNGLSHVISRFMGQEIFGYTIMKMGEERSLLAKLASDLL